ncbi:MAG TPA: CBS domain-containing protein [Terriglobales bacterium]|jgi:CBS domain-containing protein|nr:CBS domain-containing protein [Terriglobales bacterium]
MPKIADILRNQHVLSVNADQKVMEAVRLMTEFNIGAVPVLRDGALVGIFSERDLMRRVVAQGRSPGMTEVGEVMTAKPRTVDVETDVEECVTMMREAGFRHLPVVDAEQKLRGVISLRDIVMRGGNRGANA